MKTLKFILQLHVNCHTFLLKGRQKLNFRITWHSPSFIYTVSKQRAENPGAALCLPASFSFLEAGFKSPLTFPSCQIPCKLKETDFTQYTCVGQTVRCFQAHPDKPLQKKCQKGKRQLVAPNSESMVKTLVYFRTHFKEQPLDRTLQSQLGKHIPLVHYLLQEGLLQLFFCLSWRFRNKSYLPKIKNG